MTPPSVVGEHNYGHDVQWSNIVIAGGALRSYACIDFVGAIKGEGNAVSQVLGSIVL